MANIDIDPVRGADNKMFIMDQLTELKIYMIKKTLPI